jgi:hypothetical protein
MLVQYKKKTRISMYVWLCAQIIGAFFAFNSEAPTFIPLILFYGSTFPFVYGLSCWAMGKGHHSAWGFLGLSNLYNPPLGPLSMGALLILTVLPDRYKSQGNKSWLRFIRSKKETQEKQSETQVRG